MENLSPRKSSKKKWFFGILAAIIVLIVLLIVFAPFYISSNSGREMIVNKINSSIDGRVKIADLSMGWFSGIKLTDVSFADSEGAMSATVKSLYTQPHYAAIIFGDISLGQTVIDEPVIKIDLAKLEAKEAKAKPAPPAAKKEEKTQLPLSNIDLAINNGSFTVNDSSKAGKLVQLADINTKLNVRPIGQQSTFSLNLVASDTGKPTPIQVSGDIIPGTQHGWQMVGTSGNIRIDVNELDLGTLAPLVAMADPNIKLAGIITINGTARLDNGKVTGANAKIDGRDLMVSLPALKGDSFRTKTLAVTANVSTDEKVTKIEKLDAKLDWASITLKGVLPTTAKSLDDFISPQSPTELTGNLDVDLAAVLSQMPHLAGLKEGTKINSGKLTADIATSTEERKKALQAKAVLSDLQGLVNGKNVSLAKPVELDGKISSEKGEINIDKLAISSSFMQAKINGTMEALKYAMDADLASTQGELGQFVDFGAYKLGGQLSAKGNVSIKPKAIASDGEMTISQLSVASASGKAAEPAATFAYKMNLDQQENMLGIDLFKVDTSFAKVNITEATIPTTSLEESPMKLTLSANADLAKTMPWMIMAGAMKPPMKLGGMFDSTINATSKGNEIHIQTDSTKITNLEVTTAANQPPFTQAEITLNADMFVNPVEKTYKIKTFKISSPGAIDIELIKFSQTNDANTTKLQGTIKADYDWKAVTAMAAPFLPAGLQLTGKRNDTITFSSQWPYGKTDQMLANMTGSAALGWQSAEYMGLQMGQTEVKARMENGKLSIPPFSTTVNEGALNFGASADFRQKPTLLKTPQPMDILKDVHLNDIIAAQLLKHVNPIFANANGTQGLAQLHCEQLAIPLAGGTPNDAHIVATAAIQNLRLNSPILSIIAQVIGKGADTTIQLQPTTFTLQQGVLSYDNMELDIGNAATNFTGQMWLDKRMKMVVTLPVTFQNERVQLPLKGSVDKPELDIGKLIELQAQQQLKKGIEGLLKQGTAPKQGTSPQQAPSLKQGLEEILKGRK